MKRNVLSLDLKRGSEDEFRTGWGREFHKWGAVWEKARSPNFFELDRGMVRVRVEDDRRTWEGW